MRLLPKHRGLTPEAPPGVAPIVPTEGQESVWDYPRPPRVELSRRKAEIYFAGTLIAESTKCLRVLETAGAPVYMFPPEDIEPGVLSKTDEWSICEWKGVAFYFDVKVGRNIEEKAAWAYPEPIDDLGQDYTRLANYVAFYPSRMDKCLLDGERVRPQPGGFYGGWVTDDVVGPIKGEPGSQGW